MEGGVRSVRAAGQGDGDGTPAGEHPRAENRQRQYAGKDVFFQDVVQVEVDGREEAAAGRAEQVQI